MNLYRLRFWGNAFALLAFVTPLLCFALGAFILYSGAPSSVNRTLMDYTKGLSIFWLAGGVVLMRVGQVEGSHRVLLQGAFSVCIGIAVAVAKVAFFMFLLSQS